MSRFKMRSAWLALGVLLAGCSPGSAAVAPSATPTQTVFLTAYHTPTPSPSPSGLPPSATPIPSSTPTPRTYVVKNDDDMVGIAFQFGVSVSALKTANPKVHPNYMGAGTVLVIPPAATPTRSTGTPQATPTQEPPSFTVSSPSCYLDAQAGLWCLALARSLGAPLENISVLFRLAPAASGKVIEQTVSAPLDLLNPGTDLPVEVYFGQVSGSYAVDAQPAGDLPQNSSGSRYAPVKVENVSTQIDGISARVQGDVTLASGDSPASRVWVLATAYGPDGRPVGLRKWESPQGLAPGGRIPFDLTIYSLGPAIDHVSLLVEGLG